MKKVLIILAFLFTLCGALFLGGVCYFIHKHTKEQNELQAHAAANTAALERVILSRIYEENNGTLITSTHTEDKTINIISAPQTDITAIKENSEKHYGEGFSKRLSICPKEAQEPMYSISLKRMENIPTDQLYAWNQLMTQRMTLFQSFEPSGVSFEFKSLHQGKVQMVCVRSIDNKNREAMINSYLSRLGIYEEETSVLKHFPEENPKITLFFYELPSNKAYEKNKVKALMIQGAAIAYCKLLQSLKKHELFFVEEDVAWREDSGSYEYTLTYTLAASNENKTYDMKAIAQAMKEELPLPWQGLDSKYQPVFAISLNADATQIEISIRFKTL